MDIIRTVNADRRYYLDEDKIYNADSLVDTIRRFNDIKIQMYNHLYDLRYDNTGVFSDITYSQWCTDTFGINAYYACAIYSAASGALSSQNELNKIYIRSKEEDLKASDTKIGSVKEQLERKQAVKKSLDLYRTTKKWKTPYTGCQLAIDNGTVHLSGKKTMDTGSFERMVEQNIRDLKHRLKMLISSRERAGKKLVRIDKWYPSSKICSCCGKLKKELKLEDRIYSCTCGNQMNREENAAINICREGLRISGVELETERKIS